MFFRKVCDKQFEKSWKEFIGHAMLCGMTEDELELLKAATLLFKKYKKMDIYKELEKEKEDEA